MKKFRIINAAFWAGLATVLTIISCISWSSNGCELQQLILGSSIFMMFCAVFGYLADDKLRDTK